MIRRRNRKSIPVSELTQYAANPDRAVSGKGPDNLKAARYGTLAHRRVGHSFWHSIIQWIYTLIMLALIGGVAYWLWMS